MSSEKTANLGLHKWVPTDYVQMGEFNENFDKLDGKAKQLDEQLAQTVYLFNPSTSNTDVTIDTSNIQSAINDAVSRGVRHLKFPHKKNFLIKGDQGVSGKGLPTFELPSNITIDLNGSTLKIEPNDLTGYNIFSFGKNTKNSKVINGYLKGDRHEHVYKTGTGNDTHEYGTAVIFNGENNSIENLEISGFTGDGVYLGGYFNNNWDNRLDKTHFTTGDVDGVGAVITTVTTSIVSNLLDINTYSENKTTNIKIEPFYGTANDLVYDKVAKVVFYNGSTFIKTERHLVMSEVVVPKEATHFRIIFLNSSINFDSVIFIHASKIGRNNKIIDCEIFDNRRQGISTSNNENCLIEGVTIHKIDGILPKAGIDIEDSRFTLNNLVIRRTTIYNTANACIIAYDGYNVKIEDCNLIGGENGALSTLYTKKLTVRGSNIYGRVAIGNTQENTSFYNRNLFEDNMVVNNLNKYTISDFINTSVVNSAFTNMGVNGTKSTTFENCELDDNEKLSNYYDMVANGIFERCKFREKFSANRQIKGTGAFVDCPEITTNSLTITSVPTFKGNTLSSKSYTIDTIDTGLVDIKDNDFLNQDSTTMKIILRTNTEIADNYFKLHADAFYTNVTIECFNNATLLRLRKNYQVANGKTVSGFRFGGTNTYTVLSEDNVLNSSGTDFVFVDAIVLATVKSKDDIVVGTKSTDTRVKRATTSYI